MIIETTLHLVSNDLHMAEQTWSVRTLQRNISSQYYYRMLKTQKAMFYLQQQETEPWTVCEQPERTWIAQRTGDWWICLVVDFPLRCWNIPRWIRQCIDSDDRHALRLVSVPGKLYHRRCSFYSGCPCGILGLPADLEHQFRHFPVSVFVGKMGVWVWKKKKIGY